MKNITKILGLVAAALVVTMFGMHFAEATDIPADKTGCGFNYLTKEACVLLYNINDKEQKQIDLLTAIDKDLQKNNSELCTLIKAQGGKTC